MKFKKEDLKELIWDEQLEDFKVIEDKIIDHSRWSVHHEIIFSYKDKFYSSYYSRGATESQDESPYQYDDDLIECTEVVPVEKTIVEYEPAE